MLDEVAEQTGGEADADGCAEHQAELTGQARRAQP
jgi:hypothetical protein